MPAPAGVSQCFPGVVVGSGAASHDDAVENASSADDVALSIVSGVVVEEFLGGCGKVPVVGGRKPVAD